MEWIITEIDGKIASVSADYGHFAEIAARIAALPPAAVAAVSTRKVSQEELFALAGSVKWEDFRLFGTKFQLAVWETLFRMPRRLCSYTDFAALCNNPQGVRSVAHALALNPLAYLVPCHLVVPKETMDRIRDIRSRAAETTLFKGSDLYLLDTIDVGEYAYGPDLKRALIKHDLAL
jgi:O-6-methylguanine DNA methyltransferase